MEYAIGIAQKSGAKIILFYSYTIPMPLGDVTGRPFPYEYDLILEDQIKYVEKACQYIRSFSYENGGYLECQTLVQLDYPVEEAIADADKFNVDLIILGSETAGSLQKLFGTVGSAVAEKSRKPVLIVPQDTGPFSPFCKIVYATNFEEDYQTLSSVFDFVKIFAADLTILHVSHPGEDKSIENEFDEFRRNAKSISGISSLGFKSFTSGQTTDALTEYFLQTNSDLLILYKHHYSFFQRIFHKSVSNSLIFHSRFPVLIIH
jgi:nucleotide-binding universal stress UspA family protein